MVLKVSDTLITREEIATMCQRLGAQITADYQGKDILMVGILRGAVVFMADLMREIEVPCEIDFMAVSSYDNTESTGVVKIIKDLDTNIEGKDILIVEDIIDSGLTLSRLIEILKVRKPASIRICTAFDKPSRRKAAVDVDYTGMQIPDAFIVGYGLDYNGKYRNLKDICVLSEVAEV